MSILIGNAIRLLSAAVVVVALAACSNPLEDNDDDHAEVEALALFIGGQEVVTVADLVVTGKIVVAAGEQSGLITIEFRDHDGDAIHDEDLDEEFGLGWNIVDEAIATFEREGRWGFRIHGIQAGTTQLTLQLTHGTPPHPDFTTPEIPIEVTQ